MRGWWRAGLAVVAAGAIVLGESGSTAGPLLTSLDALVGLAFLAVPLTAPGGPRLGLACSYVGGLAWLAANHVDALQFAWRPLLVLAVLAVAGPVAWTSAAVVAALAAQAALPRSTADPILTLTISGAMVLLPVASAPARAAVVALALAFAVPATGVLTEQPASTSGAFSGFAAVLLATAGCLLLAAVREQATVVVGAADRVIDLGRPVSPDGLDDRRLRGALTGVALLEENRSLRATLTAQADEVRRSRVRLLEAADLERARMQARLAERVEPLLTDLELGLRALAVADHRLRADADRCCAEVASVRGDLDELSAGLHPRVLVDGGLRAALDELARRCGVDATVDVADVRFEPSVERAIWFACAELVANTSKHAAATHLELTVREADGAAEFTVSDDGHGGAHVVAGGGLGGLHDRLRAFGGGLGLTSGPRGTTVTGWVRCGAA